MANVIPNLGTLSGAATGLGAGLQELASRKIAELQRREQQQDFSSRLQKLGYSPEQSELISGLPQKDWMTALSSLPPSQSTQASQQLAQVQPESEQGPNLQSILGQLKAQTPEVSGLELLKQAGTQKLSEIGLGQKQAEQPGFTPLNAQELFEQARLQGITLTPEQQQKINNKVAAINASEDLQKQLQSFISKQQKPQASQQQQLSQQNVVQPNQPLFKKPLTTTEKALLENLEIKKRKEEREAFKDVKPYLDAQREDFKNARAEYKTAKDMLNIIEKNKDKWPTIGGYLPGSLQRDPDVREYVRLANKLVIIQSNSLKGQPTNYKTQIVERAKIDLSQPIETQINALRKIIAEDEEVFDTQDEINKIGEINDGRFPIDIAQKITKKIGRPDITESSKQELIPGTKLSEIDTTKLAKGTRLNGPDGKAYIWDGSKPVLAGGQ